MWFDYWSEDYWNDDYWNRAAGVEPPVDVECVTDWNIDDVLLEASEIIVQQMTLTRSTGTPAGDHDWTI